MSNDYVIKALNFENLKNFFGYDFKSDFIIESDLDKETLLNLHLNDCIIYNYDSVVSDKISNASIDYENIIEARFFNDISEIRVFNDNERLNGTIFIENNNPEYIESEFILYPRTNNLKYPSKLLVKKYIKYDNDGQAYVSYVKPCRFVF